MSIAEVDRHTNFPCQQWAESLLEIQRNPHIITAYFIICVIKKIMKYDQIIKHNKTKKLGTVTVL